MRNKHENPLTSHHVSKEMPYIFPDDHKLQTLRNLWITLAETEKELGLSINDQQI